MDFFLMRFLVRFVFNLDEGGKSFLSSSRAGFGESRGSRRGVRFLVDSNERSDSLISIEGLGGSRSSSELFRTKEEEEVVGRSEESSKVTPKTPAPSVEFMTFPSAGVSPPRAGC